MQVDSTEDKWISHPEALLAGGTGGTGTIQRERSPPCILLAVSAGEPTAPSGELAGWDTETWCSAGGAADTLSMCLWMEALGTDRPLREV